MTRKTGRARGRPTNLQKKVLYKVAAGTIAEMDDQKGGTFLSDEQLEAFGLSADPSGAPGHPPLDPGRIERARRFLASPMRSWIKLIAELDDNHRRTPERVEELLRQRRTRGHRLPEFPHPGWMSGPPESETAEAEGLAARPMLHLGDLIAIVAEVRKSEPDLSPFETPETVARRLFGLPPTLSVARRVKDLSYRGKKQEAARAKKVEANLGKGIEGVFRDLAARTGVDIEDYAKAFQKAMERSLENSKSGRFWSEED